MTMLSEHFSLAEMTKSSLATRQAIDNTPGAEQVKALRALCENVLEPVRALVREKSGKPLYVSVSSGYRSQQVNRAIGGSIGSQHVLGEAADIEVPGLSNLVLATWIAESSIPYDQLILEHFRDGVPDSGWVHVSHRAKARRQVLRAVRERGTTVYSSGLPPSPD